MNALLSQAKALTEPARIRVLELLRRVGELCVCELADALELRQSTLSTHLTLLRDSGFLTTRKEGKWIYYGIAPAQKRLLNALFTHHEQQLAGDGRLVRDVKRARQRIAVRDGDGRCTLGFGELETKAPRPRVKRVGKAPR